MASKSFIVVAVLCCISSFLLVKGQENLLKHSHAEYKFELGGLLSRRLQSNKSTGITTKGYLIDEEIDPDYKHVAGYRSKGAFRNAWWHGVRAKMTVWRIQDVQSLSVSSAYISAIGTQGTRFDKEIIAAGVHVHPQLYNNRDVRFFTYWKTTKQSVQVKGCYNTLCPGFVIANGSNLFPGQALASPPNFGEEARFITLRIKKDENTGDWSLYREDMGGPIGGMTLLGWWPKGLFDGLSDRADIIQWTGQVTYQRNETGPAMGNGHYPNEHGAGKAASFYDCFGFDHDGNLYPNPLKTYPLVDRPDCYDISPWYESGKPGYQHFYYGGPRCTK